MLMNRNYDTVAFDVRDNATMLFFARTTDDGDIDDYLLLMRAIGEDFDETMYIEINEQQLAGSNVIRGATLTGNVLTIELREPAAQLNGTRKIVVAYDDTAENRANMEQGAVRVLGDYLAGGSA